MDLGDLLAAACGEIGVQLTIRSDRWLYVLRKDDVTKFVIGHVFPFNTAAAGELCTDKAALADYLSIMNVPHVEHRLFSAYDRDENGLWRRQQLTKDHILDRLLATDVPYPVVVKPLRGSNGNHVTCAADVAGCVDAIAPLLDIDAMAVLSPYAVIESELRFVLLDGEPICVLEKIRRDDWRHNLSHGAVAQPVPDPPSAAIALARTAADVLDMRLATVDCVLVDGSWFVLEINNGTKLVKWANQNQLTRAAATDVYRRLVLAMFAAMDVR